METFLKKDIEKLESVQHRATKIRSAGRNMSYSESLKFTGLTTLEDRRDRGDLIEVFKFVKGFSKVNTSKFFVFATGLGLEAMNTNCRSLEAGWILGSTILVREL